MSIIHKDHLHIEKPITTQYLISDKYMLNEDKIYSTKEAAAEAWLTSQNLKVGLHP